MTVLAIVNPKGEVRSDHTIISEVTGVDATEVGEASEISEHRRNAIRSETWLLLVVKAPRFIEVVSCVGENDDIFQ